MGETLQKEETVSGLAIGGGIEVGEAEGETEGETEIFSVLLLLFADWGTLRVTLGDMKQSGDMDCVLVRLADAVILTKTGVPSPSSPSCKNIGNHAKHQFGNNAKFVPCN